ncbi:carbohydrate-binding module family 1 protein [Exserohilum turcica Et28A]|uniref:Carbohydrate-binding module family 1 protein n=1 Tax=Exserohilum turcicum (strain 28A) TaxID=671987 RepID=R0KDW5_EXST2|nr:carbohydrate-binding module family 1 protein [Exserohilum turcica Et28A]EOA91053.1 carbohydrate-binding module family 1 protein [Exserohilum turcica Et28A]
MKLTTLAVVFGSLSALCAAVPADNQAQLEPRQTWIISCIGGRCSDNISRPTSEPPKPTSSKVTTTSKKPETTTSRKPSPNPTPTPSKTTIKTTTKSTENPTKTTTEEVGPSSTRCPVPLYYKCGGWHDGKPWTGCTQCVKGAKCVVQNEWYYQCVADDSVA